MDAMAIWLQVALIIGLALLPLLLLIETLREVKRLRKEVATLRRELQDAHGDIAGAINSLYTEG